MEVDPLSKPLLLRFAPILLVGYVLTTAAFLLLMAESSEGDFFAIGNAQIPWGLAAVGVLLVIVLELVVYVALAVGFWQDRRWARPAMVLVGPASSLLLILLAPGDARFEILAGLPRVALFAFAVLAYLYWKPNVKEYFERIGADGYRPHI
jgi:hypothetical protein